MAELVETQCCGIRELDGVQGSNAGEIVLNAAQQWCEDDMDAAFIFFSVIDMYASTGKALQEYIKKQKLGSVTRMRPTHNPNSGNMLTMYVWRVNKTNLRRYWRQHSDE